MEFRGLQVPLQGCPRFHHRQLWKQKEIMCYWKGREGERKCPRNHSYHGIQHGARKTDFSAPLVSVIAQPHVEIRAEMIQGRVMEPTAWRVGDFCVFARCGSSAQPGLQYGVETQDNSFTSWPRGAFPQFHLKHSLPSSTFHTENCATSPATCLFRLGLETAGGPGACV